MSKEFNLPKVKLLERIIIKSGNSWAVTLPKKKMMEAGYGLGAPVNLTVELSELEDPRETLEWLKKIMLKIPLSNKKGLMELAKDTGLVYKKTNSEATIRKELTKEIKEMIKEEKGLYNKFLDECEEQERRDKIKKKANKKCLK